MEVWLWQVLPMIVIVILLLKIYGMKRSAREMAVRLSDILSTQTNTLIGITSGDRDMRQLASVLNKELTVLREKRHHYEQGDWELKRAVTNLSHDLRTPLTAAFGYLELLEQEELSPDGRRYVRIIGERMEAMKWLTEEMFHYTLLVEQEPQRRERVLLNAAVEESAAALYPLFCERKRTPQIELPEVAVYADLDPADLSRLLTNLMSNAAKYSEDDPKITLTEDGRMIFCNRTAGLSRVKVEKMFDRFYTVEKVDISTGLGLSIAKKLVDRMGGVMDASYLDERLSITIELPIVPKESE